MKLKLLTFTLLMSLLGLHNSHSALAQSEGYNLSYPQLEVSLVTADGKPVPNFMAGIGIQGLRYGYHENCNPNGHFPVPGQCVGETTIYSKLIPSSSPGRLVIQARQFQSSDHSWSRVYGTLTPVFEIPISRTHPNCFLNAGVRCNSGLMTIASGLGRGFPLLNGSTNEQIPSQLNCVLLFTSSQLQAELNNPQCPR